MRDVWSLPSIAKWKKSCGKHPTQKPLCLLSRIIQASTKRGAWILDPFTGSSTTGIAANLLGRRFLGVDQEVDFLQLSRSRRVEIEDSAKQREYLDKLQRQAKLFSDTNRGGNLVSDMVSAYTIELPF